MPVPTANPAAALALDLILHELRRAVSAPIFHIHTGGIAPCQAAALLFGWLAPLPSDGRRLAPTAAGLKALADYRQQLQRHQPHG